MTEMVFKNDPYDFLVGTCDVYSLRRLFRQTALEAYDDLLKSCQAIAAGKDLKNLPQDELFALIDEIADVIDDWIDEAYGCNRKRLEEIHYYLFLWIDYELFR